MPTSTEIFKKETIEFIKQRFSPNTNILDIGAGSGIYADLLRANYPNLDAVEAYEPYLNQFNLQQKYREVVVGDITTTSHNLRHYSLFILGDVFEHIAEKQAKELLQKLIAIPDSEIIVAVPFSSPQSDLFNNPYERHQQPRLTFSKMLKLYPELTPFCMRYDYAVFVTKRPENNYLPIFYKDLDSDFLEKLKAAYPYRSLVNIDVAIEEKSAIDIFKDGERNREVTIVTGLWDLGRGEIPDGFKRPYQHYKDKFAELLKSPVNMIIYASQEDEPFIWEHRKRENTFVKILEKDEFQTWFEFYDNVQQIRQKPEWLQQAGWLSESPQATLSYYNPVVMSKMFMLNNATIYNPFNSSYFYWIDAGITTTVSSGYFTHDRVFDGLPDYTDAVGGFVFLSYPYEGGTEVHGFPRQEMAKYCGTDYVRYVCRGGFFGGIKSDINSINSLYHGILSSTMHDGFMGTEENILTIIAHKFPEMVSRFELQDDGLVWRFFEILKNVDNMVSSLPRTLSVDKAKNILYILTFNSPKQFKSVYHSILNSDVEFLNKSRKILVNNSTDETLFAAYDELCEQYGFEEIHRENLGVCGGRQFIAEHFQQTDADFYMFFEDDMHINGNEDAAEVCRNGFRKYIPDMYSKILGIMIKEKFDFLKFSFSEFYGDNSVQWAWYNVPQSVRTEVWPDYNKLPEIGTDPNAPRTKFNNIKMFDDVAYITGEIYYSNWPQIVSREGNQKMFLDTTWARPYEQTWMSHMYQLTITNKLKPSILLASPVTHHRFEFYEASQRKES